MPDLRYPRFGNGYGYHLFTFYAGMFIFCTKRDQQRIIPVITHNALLYTPALAHQS